MKNLLIRLELAGLVLAWFSMAAMADVNVLYHDPPGGWTYSYLGEGDSYNGFWNDSINRFEDVRFGQLDGTWDSYNGLEQWDHYTGGGAYDYRIGTVIAPDGQGIGSPPGGILAVDDSNGDGTKYLRVQDPGDPNGYGWEHSNLSQTNKKLCFVHDMSSQGMENLSILDDGITISFRARLSTAAADPDAPLDPAYPYGGGGPLTWPTGGDGNVIQNQGFGMFGVGQLLPEPPGSYDIGSQIGFSLALNNDLAEGNAGGLGSGLIMNNLVHDDMLGKTEVDTNENSTNIVPIDEQAMTEWREFWITIEANDSTPGNGTHTVHVFMDGSETPQTFYVTAGYMFSSMVNQYYGLSHSFLQMANSNTEKSSAIDIDYFSYKEGVIAPTSAGIPGDFDYDGDVDGNDFLVWQRGESPNSLSASDLTNWQLNFGAVPGVASTTALAIPEPATFLLGVLCMIALGYKHAYKKVCGIPYVS
ncbi:MAG: hypothetical protein JW829_10860 [Pirellulales bacterium]|nr:hypothetical protein [Pirellulales bacterium]